jgi:hypothetical protein
MRITLSHGPTPPLIHRFLGLFEPWSDEHRAQPRLEHTACKPSECSGSILTSSPPRQSRSSKPSADLFPSAHGAGAHVYLPEQDPLSQRRVRICGVVQAKLVGPQHTSCRPILCDSMRSNQYRQLKKKIAYLRVESHTFALNRVESH